MNRSVERTSFPVQGMVPGTLTVAPFRHPRRGVVRFPTAPAVAAGLRRLRHQAVRVETHPLDTEPPTLNGTLFTASYLDRTGHAVGLGIAAHDDDHDGAAVARETVELWSGIWRTRRVVLVSTDLCGAAISRTAQQHHPWLDRSADAACHHVHEAQAELERFADRGDHAVLIGRKTTVIASGLPGHGQGAISVVESVTDVAALTADPDRLSYLVAPGFVIEEATPIIAALRSRYPRIRGAHPDGICYAPSDHQHAVRILAGSCDTVLLLGTHDPSEQADLVESAASRHIPVHRLETPDELQPDWLCTSESIGVSAIPTAEPGVVENLLDILSGLGPLSVVRRHVTTEVVSAQHNDVCFPSVKHGAE